MTKKQERHLKECIVEFKRLGGRKYRVGAKEHGDFLGDLPQLELVNHAIGEAIDQIFYLLTLRQKIANVRAYRRVELPQP